MQSLKVQHNVKLNEEQGKRQGKQFNTTQDNYFFQRKEKRAALHVKGTAHAQFEVQNRPTV